MYLSLLPPQCFDLSWLCYNECMRALQTHPSQGCFMSSVDLHTHYSYQVVMCCFFMGLRQFSSQFLSRPFQVMVPEAFAIVVAPTDSSRYVFPNPS